MRDRIDPERMLAEADWLRALARSLVRDPHVAEDVVQDTLVVALERGPRADQGGGPRSWLAAVARNFARRRQRAEGVRAYHEERAARRRADWATARPTDAAARELAALRLQRRLVDAVLALDEPYRSCVVLHYQRGLSHRAVAERLGITPEAARKRASRGVAVLRARLAQEVEREAPGGYRAWCLGLAAFADEPRRLAWTLPAGGLAVGMKSWIGVAACAVAALGVAWSLGVFAEPAARPGAAPASGAASDLVAPASERPDRVREDGRAAAESPARAAVAEGPPAPAAVDTVTDLHGRVVDADERPIAGARLDVRLDDLRPYKTLDLEHDDLGRGLVQAVTDERGEFAIPLDPGRPFDLYAEADGFARTVHPDAYAGEHVIVRMQPAAAFAGRVQRPDGSPVAGARLRAWRADAAPGDAFRGRTDGEGRFRFEDLQPGSLRVEVTCQDEAGPPWADVLLTAGETLERTFTTRAGIDVQGRVTDLETGRPVADAEVGVGWTFRKTVRTDADGRYVLRGFPPTGVLSVAARARGYAEGRVRLPDAAGGRAAVDFALQPDVRVTGRVVDAAGAPLADAYLAAVSTGAGWPSARADGQGRFSLAGLRPGADYALFVVASGHGSCAFDLPPLLPGQREVALGDVTLHPGGLLRGPRARRLRPAAAGLSARAARPSTATAPLSRRASTRRGCLSSTSAKGAPITSAASRSPTWRPANIASRRASTDRGRRRAIASTWRGARCAKAWSSPSTRAPSCAARSATRRGTRSPASRSSSRGRHPARAAGGQTFTRADGTLRVRRPLRGRVPRRGLPDRARRRGRRASSAALVPGRRPDPRRTRSRPRPGGSDARRRHGRRGGAGAQSLRARVRPRGPGPRPRLHGRRRPLRADPARRRPGRPGRDGAAGRRPVLRGRRRRDRRVAAQRAQRQRRAGARARPLIPLRETAHRRAELPVTVVVGASDTARDASSGHSAAEQGESAGGVQ